MILGEAGAVFTAELLCQNRRHSADQTVALGKAVPPVKSLQARQIKEQDRGICFLLPHPFAACFRQLIEIRHVRQAGHVVVIRAAVLAFFLQKPVQRLVQHALVGSLLLRTGTLVGVPGQAEAHPRLRIDAFAVGVEDDIIRVL